MPRQLPPLNALKAFEAAARSESFTRAAEELCVTQGAVSHQVKALEATLGIKLFNRERQRLVITDTGREYLNVIRDAFDRIAAGTERVLQRQNAGVLTVSTSPDFAAKWLVYRLGRFAEAHPEIDLRVSATMHHVDFAREEVDVAVRHGDGNWSGLDAARLCSEQLFPVCSPKLMSGRNRIAKPSDLQKSPLLHLDDSKAWSQWFGAAGVAEPETSHGLVLNRGRRAAGNVDVKTQKNIVGPFATVGLLDRALVTHGLAEKNGAHRYESNDRRQDRRAFKRNGFQPATGKVLFWSSEPIRGIIGGGFNMCWHSKMICLLRPTALVESTTEARDGERSNQG